MIPNCQHRFDTIEKASQKKLAFSISLYYTYIAPGNNYFVEIIFYKKYILKQQEVITQ